jgi:membrane protein YdbS with pleckstrin-like domain
MTSYVESVLAPGERIIHRAAITHWRFALSYLVGLLLIAGALAAWVYGKRQPPWPAVEAGAAVIGILVILVALVRRSTIELALTDRRIIFKSGLVARNTVEMNLSKVESLHVNQSPAGRLLGYGDVTVVGTGSSLEPLRGIADPLELRRKLGELAGAKP